MIKKIFITAFTITGLLFGIGNTAFNDLGYYYVSNTDISSSFQGYTYFVKNNGNFETYNSENTAKTFTWNPNMENTKRLYNLGRINGNLYFYDYRRSGNDPIQTVQGFLNKWCVSPVSSRGTEGYLHKNCSYTYTIDQIKGMVNNFSEYAFEVVGSIDPSWAGYDYTPLMFCFSDGENDYCVKCGVNSCPSGLTGSLNLNLGDFTNIASYNWDKSPFGGGNPRENNKICPKLGEIIKNYPTNYNTGLCYNSTLKYNNGQIETVEKENIQQIYTNYEELENRRNIYNNNCKPPYTAENCNQAFSGQRKKYSIISNGYNQNTEPKRLRNYCNIYLNYDLNMSSCIASGRQGVQFTTEEITNTLLGMNNLTIETPTTGNILNGLLEEGEERANPLDILGNIEQIKNKFTILFEERKGVNGIIPNYIIWIMLVTIILTVLFKK